MSFDIVNITHYGFQKVVLGSQCKEKGSTNSYLETNRKLILEKMNSLGVTVNNDLVSLSQIKEKISSVELFKIDNYQSSVKHKGL